MLMFVLFASTYLAIGILMYVVYFHVTFDFLYVLLNNPIVISLGLCFGKIVAIFGGIIYFEYKQTKNKKK